MVVQKQTLAEVADGELNDPRNLTVGSIAPEIDGEDVDENRMTLTEYRGRVVLLNFGSHEQCGGCRRVYPRLRAIVEQYLHRTFMVLGINENDRREVLKHLGANGEVTWRSWWDGDREDETRPIFTRWNILGYPTFFVLDHHGVIRFRDLHPEDENGFREHVEPLVRQAEAEIARL